MKWEARKKEKWCQSHKKFPRNSFWLILVYHIINGIHSDIISLCLKKKLINYFMLSNSKLKNSLRQATELKSFRPEFPNHKRKFIFDKKLRLGKVHPMVWTGVNAHIVVMPQLSRGQCICLIWACHCCRSAGDS